MRVIAGQYRSRILKSLKGLELRPTSDRLRETLFNVLRDRVEGSHFLDLYAGTGAVGIEALSRGSSLAVFVERHPPAVALIRKNLDSLGIETRAEVVRSAVAPFLEKHAAAPGGSARSFDLVFLDPPYALAEEYLLALQLLASASVVDPGGLVIVEHRHSFQLPQVAGRLRRIRLLKQGDAALSFYGFSGPPQPPAAP